MQKVTLGDVAAESKETCKKDQSDYPTVGLEHLTPGELSLSRWDENSNTTFTKLFRKGDMLFGRRRAYLKKAAVAPFDGICSGDITVIRALPGKIVPELLPFIIQSEDFFDFAVGHSAGSLSPRVKWEHLKNYRLTLPPLPKQRELAEVLWAIEDTRTAYQRLEQATEELVKSRFIEMFGDPVTNPMGWTQRSLGDICNVGSSKRIFEKEYVDKGIPFYRTKEIVELSKGNPITTELFISCNRFKEIKERYGVPSKGDLLISAVGTIGIIWVVDGKQDFYFKDGNLLRVAASDKFNSVFMKFLLEMLISHFKQEMSAGTAYAALTIDAMKKMLIPNIPIPLQNQFADFVAQADKSRLAMEKVIEKQTAMKEAVMREWLK